jgi:hypothetical protein
MDCGGPLPLFMRVAQLHDTRLPNARTKSARGLGAVQDATAPNHALMLVMNSCFTGILRRSHRLNGGTGSRTGSFNRTDGRLHHTVERLAVRLSSPLTRVRNSAIKPMSLDQTPRSLDQFQGSLNQMPEHPDQLPECPDQAPDASPAPPACVERTPGPSRLRSDRPNHADETSAKRSRPSGRRRRDRPRGSFGRRV